MKAKTIDMKKLQKIYRDKHLQVKKLLSEHDTATLRTELLVLSTVLSDIKRVELKQLNQ